MTAAPPVDRAAASRLVAALEHAWTAIRHHHPEVPEVVMVVASGSDPRSRRLNLGHFGAGRWQLTDHATDRAEVLVSGEGLQRGPVDVLGTLLHEAAHGLAHARKISDTSRQGRYHNCRYATLARELGLEVAHVQPIGWSATSVPQQTAAGYVEVLAELAAALVLWRRAEQAAPAGPGRSPQRPGLLLWLWPTDPGGPLGAAAGPDPVWRLRPTLRARVRRGRLTRTSVLQKRWSVLSARFDW